ncbi:MAG: hypothetical protein P9M06_06245 [Candidatus Saelkia tenebricola]|nr:hypothetical protein [Candidatus Saelkia tenebricola]
MKNKKIFLILIAVFFNIHLTYARRIHNPNSLFLTQLSEFLEEPTIGDAAHYDFFRRNWNSLKDGLHININETAFLEIRRTGNFIIVQVFGDTTREENNYLMTVKKNLRRQSFNNNMQLLVLDFQDVKLELEPLGAYTILGISNSDLAIIAEDIWQNGLGSGISSARGELLRFVDNMARVIDISIKQDIFSSEDIMSGRNEFIRALHKAQDDIANTIKNLRLGFEYRPTVLLGLKNLRDNFDWFIEFLYSPSGNMAYRILYREYFIPFRENMYDDR